MWPAGAPIGAIQLESLMHKSVINRHLENYKSVILKILAWSKNIKNMPKYLLDKALTVVLAGAIVTLEARNIKNEILECPPGGIYLWADVGDFSRFRHKRVQVQNQMHSTKDEDKSQGVFGQLTLAIIKS